MRNQVIHIACLFALLFSAMLPGMGQEIVFKGTRHFFEVEGQPGYKYYWSVTSIETGSSILLSGNEAISEKILFSEEGLFEVAVQPEDENQCMGDKISMMVDVKANTGLIADAGLDRLIGQCEPIRLDASKTEGDGVTYSWKPTENLDDPTIPAPLFTPGETTEFILTATDQYGMTGTDTVLIEVVPFLALNDTATTREKNAVTINVLLNENAFMTKRPVDISAINITRHPTDGEVDINYASGVVTYFPDRYFKGEDYFTYQICDPDFAECCAEANVYIIVSDGILKIPQAFSPNGDGKNDYFEIEGISSYPNANLKIFNRWGNKVYEKDNYLDNWDGTSNIGLTIGNSGRLPEGTYFFILDLGNGDDNRKGTVYLTK